MDSYRPLPNIINIALLKRRFSTEIYKLKVNFSQSKISKFEKKERLENTFIKNNALIAL